MSWAKFLLTGMATAHINGFAALAQVGWQLRLGTLMVERAIVAKARCFLLPEDHPTARLIHIADSFPATHWASMINRFRTHPDFARAIPEITEPTVTSPEVLAAARACPDERRRVLKSYRCHVVRPVLQEYDMCAFSNALASKSVLGVPFLELQPSLPNCSPVNLDVPMLRSFNLWSEQWAIVRCTGCWPVRETRTCKFLAVLSTCISCGRESVDVAHSLCCCPATRMHFQSLPEELRTIDRNDREFVKTLFQWHNTSTLRFACVQYVGLCLRDAVQDHLSKCADTDDLNDPGMGD